MRRRIQPKIRDKKEEDNLSSSFTREQRHEWYSRWRIRTAHPSLKIDYFQKIDTKEKAYWLGFLYGDGHICNHLGSILIQFKLARRDEIVVQRFCKCLGARR